MGLHRFFIAEFDPAAEAIRFPDEIARQVRLVLRLKPDDVVIVMDGTGRAFQVQLTRVAEQETLGKVIEVGEVRSEMPAVMHLFFPLSKRDKVEWILQKATEVGVHAFHPFTSERSLVQTLETSEKRATRWESILREAAEQSGRARLPVLSTPLSFKDAIHAASDLAHLTLAACVGGARVGIKAALADLKNRLPDLPSSPTIALFVGPEGGFSESEITQLKEKGAHTVTLGANILRMETAAMLFPALVLYELGDGVGLE